MAALVAYSEHVVCTVVDADSFGRVVADCIMSSDGADFAEIMIRAGHADHCPAQGRPDLRPFPTMVSGCPPTAGSLKGRGPSTSAAGIRDRDPAHARPERRRASDRGVGLVGKDAVITIHDMRSQLECIQFVRRTAVQIAVAVITTRALITLLVGIATKLRRFGPNP